ncbi:MAG TPA: 2OG-Fe(II) oxygenase family protein [Alphaproteobacteria bacterium]|nr:2OG-Fe(II) oxygenase family protein [Alphaproteobacteria bacterium]
MAYTVDHADLEGAAAFDLAQAGDGSRKAVTRLPTVDLTAFTADGSRADRLATARAVREACLDIGFFYATGHGFSADELDASLDWGHRFFALPAADKTTLLARANSANLGFIQTGGLDPDATRNTRVDLKERFYSSRELAPGELVDSASPAGQSQWPDDTLLPGFAASMKEQTRKKVRLAKTLCRALALSLDLPEDYLVDFHDRMGCVHSLNFYPATPAGAERQWGFSPHSDYGSFTILVQDRSGGLEARNAAGDWIDIPPVPGTFVVNVGDLLQRWTNDVYISSLHRVLNRGPDARMSISFFVYANPRAEIACLDSCRSADRPPRYAPVVAGAYIKELLTQAYETGRTGVSQRTAERLKERR